MNYQEAIKYLQHGRDKGRRPLPGVATYMVALDNGDIGVKYHNTVIVLWKPDGTIRLDSGGWRTATLKNRMNEYLPSKYSVWQDKGIWYLHQRDDNTDEVVTFEDGITILPDGFIDLNTTGGNSTELLKLREQVKEYAKEFMEALVDGQIGPPKEGDCLYCSYTDGAGQTWGEITKDRTHVLVHMNEGDYVPALLLRAVEVMPISIAAHDWVVQQVFGNLQNRSYYSFEGICRTQVHRALFRYLCRLVGLAS